VNPKTGTLRIRGVFPNADDTLSPGYFVRIRIRTGPLHKALLINERALDTDQAQRVVYVVDDKNEVVERPVQLGAQHDGLREIAAGLKAADRVIINGLQGVRPGMKVEPKLVPMPGGHRKSAAAGTNSDLGLGSALAAFAGRR
jgi:RND family efflux transporter MFP subunit